MALEKTQQNPTADAYGGATTNGVASAPSYTGPAATTNAAPRPAAYDKVNAFYQQHLGRDGSDAEVSQWGSNLDDQYLGKIGGSIANSAEGQAYAAKKNAPAPAPGVPAATTNSAPPATGSPVSGDGKIPPPTAAVPAVAPPQMQTYTPPTSYAQPDQNRVLQGMTLDQTPISTYTGAHFNDAAPTAYNPGQLSAAYGGDTIGQFHGLDQSGLNSQQNSLMNAIMQNPQTLNPGVVAQMKEQQKQDALLMQRQTQQGFDQNNAARGTLGGGRGDIQRANLGNDTIDRVLSGNRAVDISAAQTNRQDELNAMNASEAMGQGQLGRATQGYNTQLGGQQAQAGVNQAAAASALQRSIAGESNQQAGYQSRLSNSQFGFGVNQANADQGFKQYQSQVQQQQDSVQRALAQFGINQGVANNSQQRYATDIGAQMGQEQLKQNAVGINNSSQMNLQQFLENQRQFNNNMGLQYNQLDQSGQQNLMNWLMQNGTSRGGNQ